MKRNTGDVPEFFVMLMIGLGLGFVVGFTALMIVAKLCGH